MKNELDDRSMIMTILNELRSLRDKFDRSDEDNKNKIKALTEEVVALRTEMQHLRDSVAPELDTSLLPTLPLETLEDFNEFDTMLLDDDDMRAQLVS